MTALSGGVLAATLPLAFINWHTFFFFLFALIACGCAVAVAVWAGLSAGAFCFFTLRRLSGVRFGSSPASFMRWLAGA